MEEKNIKNTYDGGVTQGNIKEWKEKFKKVLEVRVVDGEDMHIGYFKRPDFPVFSAMTKQAKTDELLASQTMTKNCWLGGSEQMLKDSVIYLQVQKQLGDMMTSCESFSKNV